MHIVVLGSAAGGGFPQWNCNAPTSRAARINAPNAKARTQASIAVSADGENWLLVNASPDFRQQVQRNPQLWPRPGEAKPNGQRDSGLRHSPIKAVLLTSAEIDHIAGLLSMRESQAFTLWATPRVHAILAENPIFTALNPAYVERRDFTLEESFAITGGGAELGLSIEAFPVPGKVPLFLESRIGAGGDLAGARDETIGLKISSGGKAFHFIPGCARLTPELRERLRGASLLFFDGTLWRDDELVQLGISSKTGHRMGHMSISDPDGTFAAFADLDIGRKIFIHVNTTNPVLIDDSPERRAAQEHGWEVAEDGMEIHL